MIRSDEDYRSRAETRRRMKLAPNNLALSRGACEPTAIAAYLRATTAVLAVVLAVSGCRRLPPPEPPPADAQAASRPATGSARAGDAVGGFVPPTGPPPRSPTTKPAIPNEPVEVLWTQLHGARVRYRVAGPETAKTIVLLHGANYSSQTWEELGVLQRFAHAGYRVYAFDLPGYGESGKVGVDPGEWLNDLLRTMD
ncbi:MAG: alpha/beta hydrolase, partial [Planctomycetota bacterium]